MAKMPTEKLLFVLSTVSFGLCGSVALYHSFLSEDAQKPNYGAMRAHIVSMLSDDDIRRFHAQAELVHRQEVREILEVKSRAHADLAACRKDPVFRERNPDRCGPGAFIEATEMSLDDARSVEAIFEQRVMMICRMAETVRRAKQLGCLPK